MSDEQGEQYPKKKPWELEPHYSRHVGAMTSEGLHSKHDIAIQLAWRDAELARLKSALTTAESQLQAQRERAERAERHLKSFEDLTEHHTGEVVAESRIAELARVRGVVRNARHSAEHAPAELTGDFARGVLFVCGAIEDHLARPAPLGEPLGCLACYSTSQRNAERPRCATCGGDDTTCPRRLEQRAEQSAPAKTCASCGHNWTEDTVWCPRCKATGHIERPTEASR